MGLNLEVGILADLKEADDDGFAYFKEQFKILNQVLSGAGLGTHVEPEELDEVFSCDMYGYSGLHYLRRIGAHLALGRPTPPPRTRKPPTIRSSSAITGIASQLASASSTNI
jgi:hypothetical protein